jgi:hypothetical protein
MKRSRVYLIVGILLLLLGILWNIAGSLNGSLPRDVPLGFLTAVLGIFYLWRARRLRAREFTEHQHRSQTRN